MSQWKEGPAVDYERVGIEAQVGESVLLVVGDTSAAEPVVEADVPIDGVTLPPARIGMRRAERCER